MRSRQAGRSRATGCLFAFAFVLLLPRAASASDWKVVAAKSWLGFAGDTGGTKFEGRFSRWDAQISFDPAHAEQGRVVVTVDMASAASAVSGSKRATIEGWASAPLVRPSARNTMSNLARSAVATNLCRWGRFSPPDSAPG